MEIVEMLQKRAALIKELRAMIDKAEAEKRDLTPEEEKTYQEKIAEIDSLTNQINEEERDYGLEPLPTSSEASLAEMEQDLEKSRGVIAKPIPGDFFRRDDAKVKVLRSNEKLSDLVMSTENLSLGRFVRGIVTGDWTGAQAELRALNESTLAQGGYLVPTPLSTRIIDLARNKAQALRAGCLTVPMDSKTLTLAKVVGDPTAHWKQEGAAITKSDMSFEKLELSAKTLVAMVDLTIEVLEDAQNIDSVVENAIANALALELDRAILLGDGTNNSPVGIYNTTGIQTISVGGPITDYTEISNAVQKIEEQNGTPGSIIYAPRTKGAIDRFVDTTGQPLRPLESYMKLRKFVTNQIPTDLGANANETLIFVGDFSQCLVGMRKNLTIEVNRYDTDSWNNLGVSIRAYLRADVQLARPEHFCVIDQITG